MNQSGLFSDYLLVTDMDGTLLNSEKDISPENLAAIERFTQHGGRFTLATGRIASSVRRYVNRLPVNAPVILSNGAVIYDYEREKSLWVRTLPASCRNVLKRVLERFPELGVEIYARDGHAPYILQDNETTERHRRIEGFALQTIRLTDALSGPWIKILFAWEPAWLDEVAAAVNELTGDAEVVWVRSDDKYLEMLPQGATKGHALEQLSRQVGVPMERCVAMGDHLNDLEMIRRAGIGIAVANAHPKLLQSAVHSCKHHNEHAIADVIAWLEERIKQRGW
ncbi:Cof-type HAD-IIB family hydrolase [Paenibacillus naphthalenovorans]|uniref:Cof-type HAD-IIB family hydrolase n=1 Tax=Paenibacillus naphthalenovorans TaxID=162209 RepID=UPI0010BA5752|nr:Cof-type HAD-IIB family hydrolase [Paenibacillus naphthalenovorans]GCL71213.1 Cof-type HAD-IIB family hydrolase [Paenibacillus naphthalenovorans]